MFSTRASLSLTRLGHASIDQLPERIGDSGCIWRIRQDLSGDSVNIQSKDGSSCLDDRLHGNLGYCGFCLSDSRHHGGGERKLRNPQRGDESSPTCSPTNRAGQCGTPKGEAVRVATIPIREIV